MSDIPKDMRSMAEASFEQVRKTFEKFAVPRRSPPAPSRSATPAARAGAREVSGKAIAYAEQNVQASLDHAQSLLKAKDLTEVMRLHNEYVLAQMRALAEQASEMGLIAARPPWNASKPKPVKFQQPARIG